jgi:hypothetical protein
VVLDGMTLVSYKQNIKYELRTNNTLHKIRMKGREGAV